MWYRLPTKLQIAIASKVMDYGYKNRKDKYIIWGITHMPIIIEEDQA